MPEESVKYLKDYSELFKNEKLVKLVGREDEIGRIQQILQRSLKNNPLLIGPIGVGKTAILEGFAARLARGDVLPTLKGKRLVEVDLPSILLDYEKGPKLEALLKEIFRRIEETKGRDILVIKDIALLTGHKDETKELSKYLAPKIVNGAIRCLIATDLAQYKIHIEMNAGLMRGIQPIYVEEPTLAETVEILKGIKGKFQKFYGVEIPDEALQIAANLTQRFVKQRLFPEKAIDLLDEASSLLLTENETGKTKAKILTEDHLKRVVAFWTGIPLDKVDSRDKERLLSMEKFLNQRVIGQEEAVEVVSGAVRRSRSGLQDPNRPIGTFFFIGTTGVGKTELAKALAEFVFDDETALLRLDMSEFMERSAVARMVGPPPGQPGYELGGMLTEAVRLRPYQVVLFDELEKAHSEILNLLLQVLDEGRLTDGKGLQVDFRNTVIIMTSNLGANLPRYQRMDYLRTVMKPEFLARIDDIVPFHGLSEGMLIDIVKIHLGKLIKRAKLIGIEMVVTDAARKWLADEVYIAKNGVRELKRLMQHHIENPMSALLMRDKIAKGDTITIDMAKGNKGLSVITPKGETLNSIEDEESALDKLEAQEKAKEELARKQEEELPEHLRSQEVQEKLAKERAEKQKETDKKEREEKINAEIRKLLNSGYPAHLARTKALENLGMTEEVSKEEKVKKAKESVEQNPNMKAEMPAEPDEAVNLPGEPQEKTPQKEKLSQSDIDSIIGEAESNANQKKPLPPPPPPMF